MRNYRHLSTFTLVLLFLSGALKPFNFLAVEAIAACTIQGNPQSAPAAGASVPDNDATLTCIDEDTAGINAPNATGVTVTIESPDGSISVTDNPGIRLGNDAAVTIQAPDRPVTVQGNDVSGIEVGAGSDVRVEGVVSTTGDFSSAIVTGENASVVIDGGSGRRQVVDASVSGTGVEEIEIVSDGGIVRTAGQQAPAVVVGSGSMVEAIGRSQISTTGSNSDAVVLSGPNSQLNVGENAAVTTTGSMSNAVQINGSSSLLEVAGTVSSASAGTATVVGAGEDIGINVQAGGVITALSPGSSAIEMTSTGARITVAQGGEVRVTSGDSVAIIAGGGATVTVSGTVSAAGAGSQGIVLGNNAVLTVSALGLVETSGSTAAAVRIDEMASMSTVNVNSGGAINASGQAIVDTGATNTTVNIDGSVTGSGDAPVIALADGTDSVTINGSVRGTSSQSVVDLGGGDDILSENSSQSISGPGILADGGSGNDILNLDNSRTNDSASYRNFEVTNVGVNTSSALNVTNDQTGNEINVGNGSTLNVVNGGVVDLRADGTANPSGTVNNSINFAPGSTANVEAARVTGVQPAQSFSSTTFAPGTMVNPGSGFIRGTAFNDENSSTGTIELRSDFTNSAQTANGTSVGNALNVLSESANLSATQQEALNALVANALDTRAGEVILSNVSGEVRAQAAASGLNAAMQFNNALLPSGNRTSSRGATIATDPQRAERVFEQPTFGNGVWVSGIGSLQDVSSNDDSTAFDANTYGVAVGYDRAANLGTFGTAVFGVGAGYSTTDVSGISDSASVNAFSLGTYFEGDAGPLSGHVAASYSSQDISSDVSSSGGGSIFALSSEAFYNVRPNSNLAIGPIGRLGAAFGNYDGFSTDSEAFSINYDGTDVSQVTGALGVRIGGQNPVNVGFMALNLDLLYESSLGDNIVQFDGRLGESDVRIASPTANQSGFFIGAEAALAISDTSAVGFRYQGSLGSDIQSHTGEIKFSLFF